MENNIIQLDTKVNRAMYPDFFSVRAVGRRRAAMLSKEIGDAVINCVMKEKYLTVETALMITNMAAEAAGILLAHKEDED